MQATITNAQETLAKHSFAPRATAQPKNYMLTRQDKVTGTCARRYSVTAKDPETDVAIFEWTRPLWGSAKRRRVCGGNTAAGKKPQGKQESYPRVTSHEFRGGRSAELLKLR